MRVRVRIKETTVEWRICETDSCLPQDIQNTWDRAWSGFETICRMGFFSDGKPGQVDSCGVGAGTVKWVSYVMPIPNIKLHSRICIVVPDT
jgi:hypothetical protein